MSSVSDQPEERLEEEEEEVLEGELLVEGEPIVPVSVSAAVVRRGSAVPAVQTAAAVATGFLAGAATVALMRRHGARRILEDARSVSELADSPAFRRSGSVALQPGRTYLLHVRILSSRPPG
jgi:hypothetical protein